MNKNIFIEQSKALSEAKKLVKCVVVANPANTNAYILSHFNPDIPKKNITCLSRLDHNRAISQLTHKTKTRAENISGVMIFGNHSLTQYPCINNIKIRGKSAKEVIEKEWL
jgi:malate/lactate dehydrogenase